MTHIRTRNPLGGEYSFFSREEFIKAVERGGITAEWQVLHGSTGRWLPITAHPAFNKTPRKTRDSGPERTARPSSETPRPSMETPRPSSPTPRPSADLVLIYPDPSRTPPPRDLTPSSLPDDGGPVLAPDEIERVLRPRESLRNTLPPAPERAWSTAVRPSGGRKLEPEESFHVRERNPSALPRLLLVSLVALVFLAVLSAARGKKQHPLAEPRPAPATTQAPSSERLVPAGAPANPAPAPPVRQGR